MGHLGYDKASLKARWKKRVNNNGTKIYAYAYSLRNISNTTVEIRIGRKIQSKMKDKMGSIRTVCMVHSEGTYGRKLSVHMVYNKKGKCTEENRNRIKYKKRKRSAMKNKKINDKGKILGKYGKISTLEKNIKVTYGKYWAHTGLSVLWVNTSVHTVHKYGNQRHSCGPEAEGGSMQKYRIVVACIWPGSSISWRMCIVKHSNVHCVARNWRYGSDIKMRWQISDISCCSMSIDKSDGSAMDVDPLHFPELAIGGKRGKYAGNIHKKWYYVMSINRCTHYGE